MRGTEGPEDKQAALGKCLDLHFCVQTEEK